MAAKGLGGLDKMFRTLDKLSGAGAKAAAAGINAGLASFVRSTKKAIDASDAVPEVKRIAKQTIGKRLIRKAGEEAGKFGFGVGKKSKAVRGKRGEAATARAADKSKPGVGVGARNIHWFVRGTGTGKGESKGIRKTDSGASRGKTKPTLDGVIDAAISSGTALAFEAAAKKTKQVLAREVAKAKSKG